MRKHWLALLAAALALVLAGGTALADIEEYSGNYSNGLHVQYDTELFELDDRFDEDRVVTLRYTGESALPVTMAIQCYEGRDQADVDMEVIGPYELEGHDAVIGVNYYDAMSYYIPTDVDGVTQQRFVYILSCMEDVFVIDIYEYEGMDPAVNDAINAMLDSFYFYGD